MSSVPQPPPEPELPGGRGDELLGDPVYLKRDMQLIRRAIRNGWNVPEYMKTGIVEEMYLVATSSEDERNKINAAKTLIAADGADLKFEMGEEQAHESAPPVNVQVNITPAVVVQQALTHPEFLEYLERRALAEDSNPGPLCPDGGPPVADGPAPGGNQ